MQCIKQFTIMLLMIFLIGWLKAQEEAQIEFVESVPLETNLDMEEIRNTPVVWKEMIRGARQTIDIETFYISAEKGEALDEILQELRKAAKRGVKVRIISEEKFYRTYPEPLTSLAKTENIEVRIIDFSKIAGGVMHAKYFIIDRREVFFGSQNFDWRALAHIHELGLHIKNEKISQFYQQVFDMDWKLALQAAGEMEMKSTSPDEIPVPLILDNRRILFTPVYSPAGYIPKPALWDEPMIVQLMNSAKSEILIQLLSYSPTEGRHSYYAILDNAIRRAATRGVKVKIICSDWTTNKPRIDFLKSLALVPNVDIKLSTIPEFSGGFIPFARVEHCKYMVVDNQSFWLGTSNWDYGYFHNSRNVGAVIQDSILTKIAKKYFYNNWNGDYTYFIDPCKEYNRKKISD